MHLRGQRPLYNRKTQIFQSFIRITTAAEDAVAPIVIRYFGGSRQNELWRQQGAVSGIDDHIQSRPGSEWPLRRIDSHIGHGVKDMISCYRSSFWHVFDFEPTAGKDYSLHRDISLQTPALRRACLKASSCRIEVSDPQDQLVVGITGLDDSGAGLRIHGPQNDDTHNAAATSHRPLQVAFPLQAYPFRFSFQCRSASRSIGDHTVVARNLILPKRYDDSLSIIAYCRSAEVAA